MRRSLSVGFACAALLVCAAPAAETAGSYSVTEAQALFRKSCLACHQGAKPAGGLNLRTVKGLAHDRQPWIKILSRVRDGEMPPQGTPALEITQRERFVAWVESSLHTLACANGITPGRAPLRRLNRNEYAATIRDLLNIHINAGQALPADGAGGEGFDNAAETLFLSPIHAEKYLEAARQALDYGARDPRSRARFLIAEPGPDVSPELAARRIITAFLPRAFRRPARNEEIDRYLALFDAASKRGEQFDDSILYALESVLVSPYFLFRLEQPNTGREPRLVDDYELAARMSYFLWGSMPDDILFDLAFKGRLRDPEVLNEQVVRMLKDVRARDFAESFVEQWLGTRELGRDIKPDAKLFPIYYDAEVQSAIRYEPILFFQEILTENLSLLNLLDSKFTILTNKLQRHYGFDLKGLTQQPKKAELPALSHRGGLLGMAAVLAVSSYPHRTSPVLRGKWILESIIGTPPPPPPTDVPALKEDHEGKLPDTLRERLMQHRLNPVCAGCHNRIDPLGFALENYDVVGRWRADDAGKPIDSQGQLPDGTRFDGPDQLKQVLLERKQLFVRNLTTKMLGYALGRGLTLEDQCTVDQIVEQLTKDSYSAHALVRGIVQSVPFRYQARAVPERPLPKRAVAGYDRKKEAKPQ